MMKNFLLFVCAVLTAAAVTAQPKAQRKVLVEEFTNASCGPCASLNPALNSLLNTNAAKVVAIKYQVSWPGYDPMYYQNSGQSDTRVSYYGVTSVPHVKMDGNVYGGSPSGFTQTAINNEYAVASPFTLSVNHNLSPDFDSIFITVIITATQSVSGTLKAHTVIVENEIHYASAPGSNGEKDFYDVMRLMLPSADGQTLATSWSSGDADTLNFAVALPAYIYNVNQIAVVAFVQDNANKNVKQAAYSPMIVQTGDANLDAGLSQVNVTYNCGGDLNATAVLKNFGTTVLTAANVYYQLDGGAVSSLPWTGSLAANATANVTIPPMTMTGGPHVLTVWVGEPNGAVADFYLNNNLQNKSFIVVTNTAAVPMTEGFQNTAFPPTGWELSNPDGAQTWVRSTAAGGFGSSSASAKLEFFSIQDGAIDEMILPSVDLTTLTAPALTFDVAYARYNSTYFDQLRVEVSTNCGSTWTTIYNKSGTTLATAPDASGSFTPTASQWRTETVNLTNYASQQNLAVKFKGVSGYGNNLYVDNINIAGASSIEETASAFGMSVYPNPFSNNTTVDFNLIKTSEVSLAVYNIQGALVYSENPGTLEAGSHQLTLDAAALGNGFYFLTLHINGIPVTQKISVIK